MKHALRSPYPAVARGDYRSYGGSQLWSERHTLREVGCGVIAATDLLISLCRRSPSLSDQLLPGFPVASDPLPYQAYHALVEELRRHYLPLIPRHGINGLMLAAGLNRYFFRHGVPIRARWAVPYSVLWPRIEEMLDRDIPVILSIGPNLPFFWQKHMLPFYTQHSDGSYHPAAQTRAHYVTVTGLDDKWLQISSWGKKYYVSRTEYLDYVRRHSGRIVSNIIYLREG